MGAFYLHPQWGPTSRVGARYFKIFLQAGQSASGGLSREPVILGLANQGPYPSYNWVEIMSFQDTHRWEGVEEIVVLELDEGGLGHHLFTLLAELIPPGGHMMVEYESPLWRETERSLAVGIPPAATPLGYLLFSVGCGSGFKDWYISEGGREGPRKLQGFKVLDEKDAHQKAEKLADELSAFLSRTAGHGHPDLEEAGRRRARALLGVLRKTGLLQGI